MKSHIICKFYFSLPQPCLTRTFWYRVPEHRKVTSNGTICLKK